MVPHNEFGQPVGSSLGGWTPPAPPEPTVLTGRYVRLEPLAAEHSPALLAHLCDEADEALWTYRFAARPRSLADVESFVQDDLADPAVLTYAVVPLEAGEAHGLLSYARIDPGSGSVEIGGVLLARDLQRTRAATEALHLALRHVFDLGYRRCEWKCDSLNEPSRVAAHRLGLTYEGRFRRHMSIKGRNRDTDWFAVTDAEWPQVCRAHEQWLDPANFDEAGHQRVPLSDLTAAIRY